MSTYHTRYKLGKVPTFKHRTVNWHLYCALGCERKMRTYLKLTGINSGRNCTIKTATDLVYAPMKLSAISELPPARQRLLLHLLELYKQKLRLYFRLNSYPTGTLDTLQLHTLYSSSAPSRAKPQRHLKRFVRGKSLIQHLQLALSRRAYLAIRKNWKDANPGKSWAKFCSTYEYSYYRFCGDYIDTHAKSYKNWLAWDNYCKKNLPVEYHQHAATTTTKPPQSNQLSD